MAERIVVPASVAAEAGEDVDFRIAGVRVADMSDKDLEMWLKKFEAQVDQREAQFVAVMQEHVNFRIIASIVAYEVNRRKRAIVTTPGIALS